MKFHQNLEYAYVRLRSTYTEDDGREVVYVFAALRRIKEQIIGVNAREQMKSLGTASITLEVKEAPKAFLNLPNEMVYTINKAEANRLQKVLEEDKKQFLLYKTTEDK